MATKTKTEAAARTAREHGTVDPVHEETTSAMQEEAGPSAEGATDAQSSTTGRRQRRPTKMSMPKKGNGGGDYEPNGGDSGDDFQKPEDDDNSSTQTSELERLLQRGRPRQRNQCTPKEDGRMRASLGTIIVGDGRLADWTPPF